MCAVLDSSADTCKTQGLSVNSWLWSESQAV